VRIKLLDPIREKLPLFDGTKTILGTNEVWVWGKILILLNNLLFSVLFCGLNWLFVIIFDNSA